jgi:outer membrane protein OmpA-like peptidoglycan-associated protein
MGFAQRRDGPKELCMNKLLFSCILMITVVSFSACAKKSYVRQQVTPVLNKVNDLDQLTAENTRQIKDVDSRAQQAIQAASANVDQLAQKTSDASTQAEKAQDAANGCERGTTGLVAAVSSLERYRVVAQTLVQFSFNNSGLTRQAEQQLDQLGGQISTAKSYIVVVEGNTDNAGDKDYNYELSQRRAREIVRYLAAKYGVPPYRVHAIGLGDDKPIASNETPYGRQQNRRVEVQLISNIGGQSSSQQGSDDDGEQVGQVALPTHH